MNDALAPAAEGMADDFIALWNLDWRFTPDDVKAPLRWYPGDQDIHVPYAAAVRYAQQLPSCEFTTWPGVAHLAPTEVATDMWRALLGAGSD